MTEQLEMYKCNICGNMVQVMATGIGELVCCGEPMELLIPQNGNSDKELTEKHTPVIEHENKNSIIKIEHHPMVKEHYIVMLQAIGNDNGKERIYTELFYPEEKPEMIIECEEISEAYSYCNIHNLYKA